MTFLEFVVTKLLGPADHEGEPGESFWPCPFRRHKTMVFHTLPADGKFRHYWRCHSCDIGGDEFQLIRELRDQKGHPLCLGNYQKHIHLLGKWRKEWEESRPSANPISPSAPRWKQAEAPVEDEQRTILLRPVETVEAAWIDLGEEWREVMAACWKIASRKGVPLDKLAKFCFDFAEEARREL